MGNSCCAWVNKSDYLNDKEKRKEQLKRLQKIMDYDFNKGFISDITVEEIIKHYDSQLTNDLGQPVLAQVAHILITEFRKFMFLVGEAIIEEKIEKGVQNDPEQPFVCQSLIAPPLIDIIWISLIKLHDVYSDFCHEIFGTYVDRIYVSSIRCEERCSYGFTLKVLDRYNCIIDPFYCVWPNYDHSIYLSDYYSVVYINTDMIPKFIKYIEDKYTISEDFYSINRKLKLK